MKDAAVLERQIAGAIDAEIVERQLVATMAGRIERIGKVGPWCWFCGADETLSFCTCHFPIDFRCHDKFVCEPCRKSHLALDAYITRMVSFPVCQRADSRRSQYEMRLFRAAKRVCNPGDSEEYDHAERRDLAFHLAQCDPFGDGELFRAGVLRAFRVSKKFTLYQALSKELEKQGHEALIRSIRRALSAQKTLQKSLGRAESESFYQ